MSILREPRIDFQCYKLLESKGFDFHCDNIICLRYNSAVGRFWYPAPTLAIVRKWLKQKLNIDIYIRPEYYMLGINWNWQILIHDPESHDCISDKSSGLFGDEGEYKTENEAIEIAIHYVLKNWNKFN